MEEVGARRATVPVSGGLRGSPTLTRMLVGAYLRRLREANDVTHGQAAWVVGTSAEEMACVERGRGEVRPEVVGELLTRYGVHDAAERDGVLNLVREANEPGWWHRYGSVMPGWLELFVGMEQGATSIRGYESRFVPELLQTESYTRAVLEHAGLPAADAEERVRLLMRRQRLLSDPDGPNYWAVVEEATLRRCVGDAPTMRHQLRHLLDVTAQRTVTLQVVPLDQGCAAPVGGAFTLLRFAEPDLPDVVHLEQLTGSVYLEQRAEVEAYRTLVDRLSAAALTPRESADLVAALAAGI